MWHRVGKGGSRYWGRKGAGIIFTDGESILLLRRSDKGDKPYFWSIPGGKVEDGETSLGAAQRETQEETGHLPTCTRLGVFDFNDGRFSWQSFLCLVDKQFSVRLSDEHSNYKWVPISNLKDYKLHPGFESILPSVLSTIHQKVGSKDLEEHRLNNDMGRFSKWAAQLTEAAPGQPQPQEPKFDPNAVFPVMKRVMQYIGMENTPSDSSREAQEALHAAIIALARPPVGNPRLTHLWPEWLTAVTDEIYNQYRKRESGGRPHNMLAGVSAKFRDSEDTDPFTENDLIEVIRHVLADAYESAFHVDYEPGHEFKPNVMLKGQKPDDYFFSLRQAVDRRKRLLANRRMARQGGSAASSTAAIPPGILPPQNPAAAAATPPPPSAASAGKGPMTGSGIPPELQSVIDKMPPALLDHLFKGKKAAERQSIIQHLAVSLGLSANIERDDVRKLLQGKI